MKKTIQIIAVAVLCLFLGRADAQTTALKIGDSVPDITINNVSNYKSGSLKLSDFKGKLLILDFWATWCSPCISMIPKMEKLQQQFEGSIQFLPVTYQPETVIDAFLDKMKSNDDFKNLTLPKVTGDRVLKGLFPHVYLPHYVWIDGDGAVLAITSHDKINGENIRAALTGQAVAVVQKNDVRIPYDKNKPLLGNGNGVRPDNIFYHSLLTGYIDGLGGGYTIAKGDSIPGQRISVRNLPISGLFRLAYGEGKRTIGINRAILEVKDPTRLINNTPVSDEYKAWLAEGNGYCYEIIVASPAMDRFKLMQQDLDRFFPQYQAGLEKRKVKTLALVRTSADIKLASTGGTPGIQADASGLRIQNSYLSQLIAGLYSYYYQVSPYQLVNETGFKGKVDIAINGDPGDIEALNRELERYDLKFIETEREVEMLVITDKAE